MLGIVPPGGLAGYAQMSPASQNALAPVRIRGKARKRKGRGAKKVSTSTRKRKSRGRKASKSTKLKKGSPAAKAWGAKMRRLRKK